MTSLELTHACLSAPDRAQLFINEFIDDFRSGSRPEQEAMVAQGPAQPGQTEALVAAVTSALCHEVGLSSPVWTQGLVSPEPFFVFPARDFALRVRLMLESPPPFRNRRVFVPENFLSRA